MNDTAFLDAILAEPDDLTHRLVYADWLDENGRPERAELIRLQIGREGLPPSHPLVRQSVRREDELFAKHRPQWAAGLPPQARRHRFHRGFIEEVWITPEDLLACGPDLFRAAPIRRLQLRGTLRLPDLLRGEVIHRFADLLSRVRVLDLNRDYLGETAAMALLSLPRLPRLEALHLRNNALSPAGLQALSASGVLDSLRLLEVTPSSTGFEALLVILHSQRLGRLEQLILAGTRMGDRLVRLLVGSPLLPHLRSLSLGHGHIVADGTAELMRCPGLVGLEQLDLSFNPIGVDGARALAASPHLGSLRWLNLSRTAIGDEGARALARSPLLGQLFGLDLSLCRLGPDGGLALATSPHLTKILTLDLIYNQLRAWAEAALVARFGPACLLQR